MSYIMFEMDCDEDVRISKARNIFERANKSLKLASQTTDCDEGELIKEDRVTLLQRWKEFEKEHGDEESREKISKLMPYRTRKRIFCVSIPWMIIDFII